MNNSRIYIIGGLIGFLVGMWLLLGPMRRHANDLPIAVLMTPVAIVILPILGALFLGWCKK